MNNIEREVADWLLKHGKDIISEYNKSNPPKLWEIFPDDLYDAYLEWFPENIVNILKDNVIHSLNINYEECSLFFDKKFVIMILGKDVLCPPKSGD